MARESTCDTALHAAVRIINSDSAKITQLEAEVARLTAQRDRLAKQIALDAQNEDCAPDNLNDYGVVRWNTEVGFLVEEDYELFSKDHITIWEDIPNYFDD